MHKLVKVSGLLAMLTIFAFTAPAFAQDVCNDDAIAKQVYAALAADKPSPQVSAIKQQVDTAISRFVIKRQYRGEAEATALEVSLRHAADCKMPKALRDRIANVIAITKDDAVTCQQGQFLTAVERQYRSLQESDGYPIFEELIKSQISDNIVEEARLRFLSRWEDKAFRSMVIKAGLEVTTMFANNCANIQDPILDIIADF